MGFEEGTQITMPRLGMTKQQAAEVIKAFVQLSGYGFGANEIIALNLAIVELERKHVGSKGKAIGVGA